MKNKDSSSLYPLKKKSKSLEEILSDESKVEDMEEFYLKIRVDIENAFSGKGDYLRILEEVYSHSEKEYSDSLRKFGLEGSEKKEEILLISCFRNSGYLLFDYSLSDKIDYKKSVSFILNAIKNYVKYKLGELIEILSMESQNIHFFIVENAYIVSIVTSKNITRDRISSLAIQIVRIIREFPDQTPQSNLKMKSLIDQAIEVSKASLIREHHKLKVILIGDGAVGKTSIRRRYLGEGFDHEYQMTIGADLAAKKSSIIYTGGKQIKYVIWDLAGQPRFSAVRKAYYQYAIGALVVFDMTRPSSFHNIVAWMNELWRNNGRGPIPLIVLGNKADLCTEGTPCVPKEKVISFVYRLSQISEKYRGFKIYFLPTSAKTALNIEQAFELLGEAIMDFLASTKNRIKIPSNIIEQKK